MFGQKAHPLLELIKNFVEWTLALLKDPGPFIAAAGYPGLATIVFLETGAMVFWLPGDSLLFVAGMYAAKGDLNIAALNALLVPMAILGDATSYWIGRSAGPKLFNRPKSRFFNPAHVQAAKDFYDQHGGKAIVLARFMPLVRTFVPVVAGVSEMRYRDFAMYNVVGGIAWVASMTVAGYFLGQFDVVRHNLEKVIIVIVVLSIMPAIIGFIKQRRGNASKVAGTPPSA